MAILLAVSVAVVTLPTWHISVIVSSNTPPASSAPSPTSLTFQARDGSRSSSGFRLTTCFAICTKMGLPDRPLQECRFGDTAYKQLLRASEQTEFVTVSNYQCSQASVHANPAQTVYKILSILIMCNRRPVCIQHQHFMLSNRPMCNLYQHFSSLSLFPSALFALNAQILISL